MPFGVRRSFRRRHAQYLIALEGEIETDGHRARDRTQLEFLGILQLLARRSDVMSEAMQERLHRWNASGVETKKQVRGVIAAMAFQNIGLEIGEHRRLIGI